MYTWVVVKMMVPFGVLSVIRHLVCRDPEGDHNFDNHPYALSPMIYTMAHIPLKRAGLPRVRLFGLRLRLL